MKNEGSGLEDAKVSVITPIWRNNPQERQVLGKGDRQFPMNAKRPLRVLTIVSNKSPAWEQSPEGIIQFALRVIAENNLYDVTEISVSNTKLLAIQYYRVRKMFVFDISNESYDPAKGHLPEENELPVVVIHLSNRNIASRPHPGECARINETVRYLHDANGFGSTPPFVENHTSGTPPNYPNPRSLRRSGAP
ncbi:conserved hypothetical protein [Talaromyces stipitatus ATCC 10500]|uniref:Uncharacterized protein n=1 Tax=Talaromyces stipitatus (strain ATCC 10500 / CBS 375.48 / QM 6759 / NRRL 1006) TaxID=441959 RepID=B8M0C7_TALSN|nr:uncharacterized protein TSTA_084550 [Talaromyces stipitatus ATCC 10500]EED21224.1 conserved hypothetical protein [Talaromyces stipitatus ATCC 10500]